MLDDKPNTQQEHTVRVGVVKVAPTARRFSAIDEPDDVDEVRVRIQIEDGRWRWVELI